MLRFKGSCIVGKDSVASQFILNVSYNQDTISWNSNVATTEEAELFSR